MLRITDSQNAGAAVAYFQSALSHGDYYAAEVPGKWHGLAAARLGLIGAVDKRDFVSLLENVDPRTGERLTPRTKDNRRPGTDFTFNAPKSVSLLHALTGDDRILAAFRAAVVDTMREIEREVKTRVRIDGAVDTRTTANIAWAEFLHTTSRPVDGVPDPHLHIHAYVLNATWDKPEQRWKALDIGDVKGDGIYFEAAFLARLAAAMSGLGYQIERHGRFWDIAGIPRATIERFSRRTAEIEAKAEELGISNPDTKAELGKRTREKKGRELSPEDCRAEWEARAGTDGRAAIQTAQQSASRNVPKPQTHSPREAVEHALSHSFERASVATEKSIRAAALQRGYGTALPETVRAVLETKDLVTGTIAGRQVVTRREVLAEETRMIAFARAGRLSCRPMAPSAKLTTERLTHGQKRAIEHVWRSPDRVMVVRGGAGTGKTTLMQTAVTGLARAGKRVAVFAPTSAARDVLKSEGFSGAETLQKLLGDPHLQAALAKSVIWVDEAGLISVPDMAKLFDLAERLEARVILSGDPNQHGSVTRGDALRIIERNAGIRPAAVTEIVRQRGAYKDAVAAIAAGDVARGWELLDAQGALIELPQETRLDRLAADYAHDTKAGKSVLVVAPTHAEKDRVTSAIRATLSAEGRLGEARRLSIWHDLKLTEAERRDPARYAHGQWIRFTQNTSGFTRGARFQVSGHDGQGHVLVTNAADETRVLPLDKAPHFKVYAATTKEFAAGDLVRITENGSDGKTRFVNGAIHSLKGFDADGNLRLDNGKVLPKDYGSFDHGYASTSHSAQGRTVDTVLVAMSAASLAAASLEQFYVSASRGREAMRLYTDDKAAVREAVMRSGQRGSATELVEQKLTRKLKPLHALPRAERFKAFTEIAARHMRRKARDLDISRDDLKAARHAAQAEYLGRVQELGPELGG